MGEKRVVLAGARNEMAEVLALVLSQVIDVLQMAGERFQQEVEGRANRAPSAGPRANVPEMVSLRCMAL